MTEYGTPIAAVLVAGARSGSTFLAACLDSHPDIGFERGEPLHERGEWLRYYKSSRQMVVRVQLSRMGYQVAGMKIMYDQLARLTLKELARFEPRIIHLMRQNVLDVETSRRVAGAREGQAHHTYKPIPMTQLKVDPQALWLECKRLLNEYMQWQGTLLQTGLPYIEITYEELLEGRHYEDQISEAAEIRLMNFLDFPPPLRPLTSSLRRTNPYTKQAVYRNWFDIVKVFKNTELEYCLE